MITFKQPLLTRLLRYTQIYTTSDPKSDTVPSSPQQWDLLHLLKDEMSEMGLTDITVDPNGYVFATLPANTDKVFFGAFVSLEDDAGEALHIRLVGHDEIDTQKHWISVDAPMAKALLGKEVDDEITVITPNGEAFYTITDIRYAGASPSA